ncbi:MAG: leucine-rich repeat domain-containing protein, partial [Verrucomicrobia bacterium]|nr:leucine-rich repeat domain-containing protein [Verrucomicrobiota bacterium]
PNLTVLHCGKNRVQDFSPLAGLSLRELSCDFNPQRDAPVLRQIRSLQTVNGLPAGEFWKRQGLTP